MATSHQQQGVKSIEIGMQVLTALEQGGGPMPLSKIAADSGLQPSKAHRYLVSLLRTGLVSQEVSTGLYNLGPSSRRLGAEALRRVSEVTTASHHAPGLRDRTGHSVYLAVWTDAGPSLVREDHGRYPLPIQVRVGSILPIVESSLGRVFLAYLPESLTLPILREQQKHNETAQLSADQLADLVADVRDAGLAIARGSVVAGLNVVSAPVFGPQASLEIAIGVAVPARWDNDRQRRRVNAELLATARAISAELGYREPS